jgi:hypothetical protein
MKNSFMVFTVFMVFHVILIIIVKSIFFLLNIKLSSVNFLLLHHKKIERWVSIGRAETN